MIEALAWWMAMLLRPPAPRQIVCILPRGAGSCPRGDWFKPDHGAGHFRDGSHLSLEYSRRACRLDQRFVVSDLRRYYRWFDLREDCEATHLYHGLAGWVPRQSCGCRTLLAMRIAYAFTSRVFYSQSSGGCLYQRILQKMYRDLEVRHPLRMMKCSIVM